LVIVLSENNWVKEIEESKLSILAKLYLKQMVGAYLLELNSPDVSNGLHRDVVEKEIYLVKIGDRNLRVKRNGRKSELDLVGVALGGNFFNKRKFKSLLGVRDALKEGCRLHAFRSGGGLRVVRLEKKGKLVGYGEHWCVEEALVHAGEDFLAGNRPYNKQYKVNGKKGKYPHYLTGSSIPTSKLDKWLLGGNTFDAWKNLKGNSEYVFQLKGLKQYNIPSHIVEKVIKTHKPVSWKGRGFNFLSYPTIIPNGDEAISTKITRAPKDKNGKKRTDDWFYHVIKTGESWIFFNAIKKAIEAPEVETQESD